jgi:hypothetical protein
MNTVHTLLKAMAVSAIMLPATLANAATPRPLVITNVSGAARIQQPLPCGNNVDLTTQITQGYMGMTWFQLTRGEVLVDLTRLTMFLTPFQVEANCNDVSGSVEFREIGLELASSVRFKAQLAGESGVVHFRIPKERFLIYESIVDDAPVQQPEKAYRRPSEDVTGMIDLRNQTVQLHVVLSPELRFRVGCIDNRCAIDETHRGTITTDIRGRSAPPAVRRKK